MSRPLWVFGIVILALVIFTLWLGFGAGRRNEAIRAEVQMTPRAGGTVMPTSSPTPPPTATGAAASSAEPDETSFPMRPGQRVLLVGEAGDSIPLHADARVHAPPFNVYPAGTQLTILEPSGEYSDYPVRSDDLAWYRVRDANGLVGWIQADRLTEASDPNGASTPSTPTPVE